VLVNQPCCVVELQGSWFQVWSLEFTGFNFWIRVLGPEFARATIPLPSLPPPPCRSTAARHGFRHMSSLLAHPLQRPTHGEAEGPTALEKIQWP